jgi:hypothetical protein
VKPIWVAVLHDGGVLVEGGNCATWDDVPRGARVRRLEIRDADGGATFVSLDGFARCYAWNECTALVGARQGVPSAKVIGCVLPDGTVREVRLAFEWWHSSPAMPGVAETGLRGGIHD